MTEISKLLFENGIIMDSNDKDDPIEMDSITFASLMISFENYFNITVPTDMLLYHKWKTISLIEKNINDLRNENQDS